MDRPNQREPFSTPSDSMRPFYALLFEKDLRIPTREHRLGQEIGIIFPKVPSISIQYIYIPRSVLYPKIPKPISASIRRTHD